MTTSGISDQSSPDSIKVGQWLFQRRTSLPVAIALALLFIPAPASTTWTLPAVGVILTGLGEALRLWAVRHIGVISRTRSDRVGPLVSTGPFGVIRNPIYVGNILIWVGFALTARLPWLAPIVALTLCAGYSAIVRWEEALLESRLGNAYRQYAAQVPRWIPKAYQAHLPHPAYQPYPSLLSFRDLLFSERGTMIAIAVGYGLLWIKSRVLQPFDF